MIREKLYILIVCDFHKDLKTGQRLILIEEDLENRRYLCSNNTGHIEHYPKYCLKKTTDDCKIEVKKVVALKDTNYLKKDEIYSVYNIDDNRYCILGNDYILRYVNSYYFMEKHLYDKYKCEPHNLMLELFQPYYDKIEEEELEIKNNELKLLEKEKQKELEKKQEKERKALIKTEDDRFKDLVMFINDNVEISLNNIIEIDKIKKFNLFKYQVSIAKHKKINDIVSLKIKQQELLNKVNSLPYEVLGKIKFIENELIVIHNLGFSIEICKLLKESLDIVLVLYQYETNQETINKTIDMLDNMISYIQEIKTSKEMEEKYITKQLINNINNTLNNNSEIIKSMISDTKMFSEIYK